MVLTIQTNLNPAVTITRTATKSTELVYIAVANKPVKYPEGRSKIVYIGTTKNGAERIAASAAAKAKDMLGIFGVSHLEFFVVASTSKGNIKTWHKLERGLILAFREKFGAQPQCNVVGKKLKWSDELEYFTRSRLDSVIDKYSTMDRRCRRQRLGQYLSFPSHIRSRVTTGPRALTELETRI